MREVKCAVSAQRARQHCPGGGEEEPPVGAAGRRSEFNSSSCSVCLQLVTQYSFLDYVMGGCQINFTVREELRCHYSPRRA